MIVGWNKQVNGKSAGVLVLPCVKDGVILKKIFILPGNNNVPDEDWNMARDSCLDKIEEGTIKEYTKEVTKVSAPVASKETASTVDYLTEESFPYNDVISILKDEDMLNDLTKVYMEETGKKRLNKKWLVGYFKDPAVAEDWEVVLSKLSGVQKDTDSEEPVEELDIEVTGISLTDMDHKTAAAVIQDTWNLETLEQWKESVSQPDLRVLILNQIETVNKPPKGKGK